MMLHHRRLPLHLAANCDIGGQPYPRRTPFGIFVSIDDYKNDNEHETQKMIQDLLSGHGNTITTTTNASDPRHLQNRRLTQSWHVPH
jgi:hypothetical protein